MRQCLYCGKKMWFARKREGAFCCSNHQLRYLQQNNIRTRRSSAQKPIVIELHPEVQSEAAPTWKVEKATAGISVPTLRGVLHRDMRYLVNWESNQTSVVQAQASCTTPVLPIFGARGNTTTRLKAVPLVPEKLLAPVARRATPLPREGTKKRPTAGRTITKSGEFTRLPGARMCEANPVISDPPANVNCAMRTQVECQPRIFSAQDRLPTCLSGQEARPISSKVIAPKVELLEPTAGGEDRSKNRQRVGRPISLWPASLVLPGVSAPAGSLKVGYTSPSLPMAATPAGRYITERARAVLMGGYNNRLRLAADLPVTQEKTPWTALRPARALSLLPSIMFTIPNDIGSRGQSWVASALASGGVADPKVAPRGPLRLLSGHARPHILPTPDAPDVQTPGLRTAIRDPMGLAVGCLSRFVAHLPVTTSRDLPLVCGEVPSIMCGPAAVVAVRDAGLAPAKMRGAEQFEQNSPRVIPQEWTIVAVRSAWLAVRAADVFVAAPRVVTGRSMPLPIPNSRFDALLAWAQQLLDPKTLQRSEFQLRLTDRIPACVQPGLRVSRHWLPFDFRWRRVPIIWDRGSKWRKSMRSMSVSAHALTPIYLDVNAKPN